MVKKNKSIIKFLTLFGVISISISLVSIKNIEKLKLQKKFIFHFNNELNKENTIENFDLKSEYFVEDIKRHQQRLVSNKETLSEVKLQLLMAPKSHLSKTLIKQKTKIFLLYGFLSLLGIGALAGIGYGIWWSMWDHLTPEQKNEWH
ncbi:hypothetical protein [Mycoplasma phocimorsus]|uniref:hypothetical protein n=1 Tax=Mycoplasma phocimorsus TaxID=3045839 RepID=UPI0024BFAF8D|nr:hypothetical protein [Mycoplasma phocimorsus]MDJ1646465.1 hypothetical protein [Mycoplasma phocimorsus]MDJ1648875.1 hypothetical protein [Mycoplasma phocimorsus]